MKISGSYDVSTFSTSIKAEIKRLNAQVDLFWSLEFDLLVRYGLNDGMDVLDCGCGPGRLIELLKDKLPDLKCTGLEMNPQLVEAAEKLIRDQNLNGCIIKQGTAENNSLVKKSFDIIIMRLVLEHVPDPVMALSSLAKLLRENGKIIVISNDFEFHLRTWPPVRQLDQLYDAYCRSRIEDGGDPCIGRRVPSLMEKAGLQLIGNEIVTAHNAQLGDTLFLKAEGAGIPAQLVNSGVLKSEILEEMTRSWRAMLKEPGHSIVRPLFVAVGKYSNSYVQSISDQSLIVKAYDEPIVSQKGKTLVKLDEIKGETIASVIQLLEQILKDSDESLENRPIRSDDLLIDIGLDSLAALDLQEGIKDFSGVEFPLEMLLENNSVGELSAYLDKKISVAQKNHISCGEKSSNAASDSWEDGEI